MIQLVQIGIEIDETAAIFWQEGNANSITYDGQEYRNIGETYSIYQSGMRYDYQQDKIIKSIRCKW